MHSSQIFRQSGVVTLDHDGFDEACAALMRQVGRDGFPDALIGIRTGGYHVAQSMAKAVGHTMPVISLTCRRPSSRFKTGAGWLKQPINKLPRPIVDRLRLLEHAILTRRTGRARPGSFQFDATELTVLDRWLDRAGQSPSLLVVDDAIDTGATLSCVLDIVARHAPPTAKIRSAVITVTTPDPWVLPGYTLYDQQLCRFPWSLDA